MYKKCFKRGDRKCMHHERLLEILASLTRYEHKLKNIAILFGKNNNIKYSDIACSILYIIADTEGTDKTYGQYGCPNLKVSRHCRMCDVDSKNLDNGNYHCTYLKFSNMHYIALHGTEDERKNILNVK